ncbi:DUF72 domain-containing protein [Actinospica robiniae]|uniref:DUF72 domain-containing protein n=1 Tax=Actinospica robiniae TaxID=304901 RepID=UPI00041E525D|nr:DUF72 domain-containing protein [Actinospica robiniae]
MALHRSERILVGTAGWADRDLVASGWYPPQTRTAAARLAYYAERFPLVEVDMSYYAIPTAATVSGWVEATDDLIMDVKAFRLLTGHSTPIASLPPQLRAEAPRPALTGRNAPEALLRGAWQHFRDGLEPLRAAGRLGRVLLRFPASVMAGEPGVTQVAKALELCRPLPAAVEFRHASWLHPERRAQTLDLLADHDAAYVCVDMPQHSACAMPPDLEVTAPTAVIRLHGRSRHWIDGDKRERYRYDYTPAETEQWSRNARLLTQQAHEVHVIVNTCCAGTAQRTAAGLQASLRSAAVSG